jgi:hypothetical protein
MSALYIVVVGTFDSFYNIKYISLRTYLHIGQPQHSNEHTDKLIQLLQPNMGGRTGMKKITGIYGMQHTLIQVYAC